MNVRFIFIILIIIGLLISLNLDGSTLVKLIFDIIPLILKILLPILILLAILFYVIWRRKEQSIHRKWYRFCRNLAAICLALVFLFSMEGRIPGCSRSLYPGLIYISSYQYRPAVDNTSDMIVDVNFIFEPRDPGSYFVSHEGYHLNDFPGLYYYWIENIYTYLKYSKLMSYLFTPPRKISYEVSYTLNKSDFEEYMDQKQFDSKETKQTTIDEPLLAGVGCLPYIGIDAFEFSANKGMGYLLKRTTVKPYGTEL